MKVAIASDHGGFLLKERIKEYLEEKGYEVKDFGCYSEERCDYPDYGFPASEAVGKGECDRGILICKTGLGMSIVGNKVRGVRAALCPTIDLAKRSREHNDANVLVLPGEKISFEVGKDILETWFSTGFFGDRHKVRLEKIEEYEKRKDLKTSFREQSKDR